MIHGHFGWPYAGALHPNLTSAACPVYNTQASYVRVETACMTEQQKLKLDQLEDELGVALGGLPRTGESNRYVFTEVNGVTVLITLKSYNPRGASLQET
jgi:hypothetical protein